MQGSDDGQALAGTNSEGDLAASKNSVINKFGDRSASPPDSSLIWGSSGHSGWIKARPQDAAVVTPHRAWDLWESNPR